MRTSKVTVRELVNDVDRRREFLSEVREALVEVDHLPIAERILTTQLRDTETELNALLARLVVFGDDAP